jgi:hypothetical protein
MVDTLRFSLQNAVYFIMLPAGRPDHERAVNERQDNKLKTVASGW